MQRYTIEKNKLKDIVVQEDVVTKNQFELDTLQNTIDKIQEHQTILNIPFPDIKPLEKAYTEYSILKEQEERLNELFGMIEEWGAIISQETQTISTIQTQLKKELKGRCPICGNPLRI